MGSRVRSTRAPSRSFASLVAALALVLSPRAAAASSDAALIDELLCWIGEAAGHDVATVRAAPPEVVIADPGEWLGSDESGFEVEAGWGGAWDPELGAIVLVSPWNAGDVVDRSVLLHELAHVVQSSNGLSICDPDAEREAYGLQARWLAEHGLVLLVDWDEVRRQAPCDAETGP